MGIQGLLPLLKPIQKQKHLSELAGQTLAVDGYVWLHRGAYACATELAVGKPTTKYVDFSMHRVRLLKYHKIRPFIVFDGGPLPAKGGTEKEREKKRAENMKKANVLAAQGKHSQAREYYTKCVDVTPQMAYQVIKALKAEGVPYIVAPYEADAQMAHLERSGIIDGIITEDSDLLVFGCKNVHFKLDIVSATVISISRADFGSPSLSAQSLSLAGWSDMEFRWMAMLSGCDYLPNIPGIGLKTAWSLLRKHKTVEKVIRAIEMEGKKSIPKGYLEAFALAEKVFLHQRVYDPGSGRLVHLTRLPVGETLERMTEAYVGKDLLPSLAKAIAEGDACPISLSAMEDICPAYTGTTKKSKPLPLEAHDQNTPFEFTLKSKGTQKEKENVKVGGDIRTFFNSTPQSSRKTPQSDKARTLFNATPQPTNKKTPCSAKPHVKPVLSAGRASGKRTLVDLMENEAIEKRRRHEADLEQQRQRRKSLNNSRYFSESRPHNGRDVILKAGPSRRYSMHATEIRREGTIDLTEDEVIVIEDEDEDFMLVDPVVQEDGYLSPSPSISRVLTPDLSSPERPRIGTMRQEGEDIEQMSSPTIYRKLRRGSKQARDGEMIKAKKKNDPPTVLVPPSSPVQIIPGPDLRLNFDDEDSESEIGFWDDDKKMQMRTGTDDNPGIIEEEGDVSMESTPSSSGPSTPPDGVEIGRGIVDVDVEDIEFEEDVAERLRATAYEKVANGWRRKYSLGGTSLTSSQPTPSLQQKVTGIKANNFLTRRDSNPLPDRSRSLKKPRRSDPYPMERTKRKESYVVVERTIEIESIERRNDVGTSRGRLDMFRYAR